MSIQTCLLASIPKAKFTERIKSQNYEHLSEILYIILMITEEQQNFIISIPTPSLK